MASYTITPDARWETSINKTLSGTTADLVIIDTPNAYAPAYKVNILNRATSNTIYYRRDYVTAVAAADGTNPIPAGTSVEFMIERRPGGTKISVVGSGDAYSVTVIPAGAFA